jgi:hypothetical protein
MILYIVYVLQLWRNIVHTTDNSEKTAVGQNSNIKLKTVHDKINRFVYVLPIFALQAFSFYITH